ncbi:hypothetical protein [Catellatospora sp. NPDC049133]|uniref:hypothetical protein n=1 Tax=Catellatospora sp. NPDC049133 TaxID=3155499 RepID=UPI0033F402BD
MPQQRLRVLDVVEVRIPASRPADDLPEAPQRGTVTEVRQYPDGRYRCTVWSAGDEVACLYDEELLVATGDRAALADFALPGPFRVRDEVTVLSGCGDPEISGRIGVVDGSHCEIGDPPSAAIGVWIEALGAGFAVRPQDLRATGKRMPASSAGPRRGSSTQVTPDGKIRGQSTYTIVESIKDEL